MSSFRHACVIFWVSALLIGSFWLTSCNEKPKADPTAEPAPTAQNNRPASSIQGQIDSLTTAMKAGTNPILYHERAKLYAKLSDYKSALSDMKSVLMLDSTKAPYYETLGEIYLKMTAVKPSKSAFVKALSLDSSLAIPNMRLGQLAFYQKEYENAFRQLNTALRKNVNLAEAYYWKGMVYKEQGNEKLARSSFQTATEQDPSLGKAFMQLGLIAKADTVALAFFNNAVRADSTQPDFHYARGLTQHRLGQLADAELSYLATLRHDTAKTIAADTYFALGEVLTQQKKYPQAVEAYQTAFEARNGFFKALYFKGKAFEQMKDYANARATYEQILREYPDYKEVKAALKALPKA